VLAIPLPDLINRHDIGMMQPGGCLGFRAKALQKLLARNGPCKIIFTATRRSRLVCRALYTTPMPPRAISSISS